MTKIKYCGIRSEKDIETINRLKIDYVGFVFAKKSRRYVSANRAFVLKKLLDENIKTVGVFVDENINSIVKLYKDGIIDIAQLHGNEDDVYIECLRNKCNIKIIKAFGVDSAEDILKANQSAADIVLLDSQCGGSGKTFDWKLLGEVKRDYLLAGGISSENVREVINNLKPFGVDVSSGIETDGIKDEEKMIKLAELVREERNV